MGFIIAAAVLAVLASLALMLLPRATPPAETRAAGEFAIYRDQLAEIERDAKAGTISQADADAQRTEIGRRLLAAEKERGALPQAGTRRPLYAALVLPILAVPLYMAVGSPGVSDVPRAQRLAKAVEKGDLPAIILLAERQVAGAPKTLIGWQFLAANYPALQRYGDAAAALRKVIELDGPTAKRYADLAEMLTLDAKGLMPAEAVDAVTRSLAIDATDPKARFYGGLAASQAGRRDDARQMFTALLKDSPADAPWRGMVEAQMAQLDAKAPALTADQMAAASTMSGKDQQAMIRTMVDGLEERLKTEAADAEGWLRLIRARTVLGENGRAREALASAREALRTDQDAAARLAALAKELGLE